MSLKNVLILLTFVVLLVIYWFFGYTGHFGYDDLHYAKLASDLNNGMLDLNDHFSFRTPILFLTAFFYSILGISDFSSSLPALTTTVVILTITTWILRRKDLKTLIVGLSLILFSNWFIFYSNQLMPDIFVALSVISSLAIIHRYKYDSNSNNPFLYALFLSLALLFGFMAKGTIILIVPLLLYFSIIDFVQKRDVKFWNYSILSGILVFAFYFIAVWYVSGDPFKRFEALANGYYLNPCSYSEQSLQVLLKRISFEFFNMTIYQVIATGFVFVIAHFIKNKSGGDFKFKDSFSFWAVSALILLLSSNFMTISLSAYSPMCIEPRHYLFLIPIVAVPASTVIVEFIEHKKLKVQIVLCLLAVTIVSYFLPGSTFLKLYLPLTILFATYSFIKIENINPYFFLIPFVILLSLSPIEMLVYAQKTDYWKQKEIFSKFILSDNTQQVVITNEVQKRLADYYNGFKNTETEIISYDDFKNDSTDTRRKVLFLNPYTRYLTGMGEHDLPYYAKNISPKNRLIFEDQELNLAIYEMVDFTEPKQIGKTLFRSFNDFEKPINRWKQEDRFISTKIKYEGEKSYQVIEYSATLEYPIDSLLTQDFGSLIIRCNINCYFEDKTEAKLAISVDDNSGIYIFKSIDINKYLEAYSHWWPITYEVKIDRSELKENSKLLIYLWNIDKQIAYIDNFEVEVIGTEN